MYDQGQVSQLERLDAERNLLSARLAQAGARREQLAATATLFKALGWLAGNPRLLIAGTVTTARGSAGRPHLLPCCACDHFISGFAATELPCLPARPLLPLLTPLPLTPGCLISAPSMPPPLSALAPTSIP